MRTLLPLTLALVALVGCGPAPGEGEVTIGSGEWRFEPVADGDEVELVRGSQGGWHVWVSMEARGLDPRRVEMDLETVIDSDMETHERSIVYLDFQDMGSGGARFIGWPAVLSDPACASGRPLEITVTLTDQDGHVATDTCTVTPMPEVGDPGECAR